VTVFLDTGYFVAFLVPRDQWNRLAEEAARPGLRAVTSSLILNETVSLLQARGLLSTALDWLRGMRLDPNTEIIHVDAPLQDEAWELLSLKRVLKRALTTPGAILVALLPTSTVVNCSEVGWKCVLPLSIGSRTSASISADRRCNGLSSRSG
jgi:predicted nucleic acid-binding protein